MSSSASDPEWRRLAAWTWVTGSISTIGKAILPAMAGAVGAGAANALIGLAVALGITLMASLAGLIPWLTTSYRVTPTHLEVRRGLLNRTTLTARLDRVRSVDLQASLVHRFVGVTKMSIGTGVDESQITLDSLTTDAAAQLRRELLHAAPAPADDAEPTEETTPTGSEIIATLDWSWIKYAPLNLKNLALALGGLAAVVGLFADALPWDVIGIEVANGRINGRPLGDVMRLALIGIPVALVGGLGVWVIGSCVGYAIRWWGLEVVRESGREGTTLRRSHGLTSKRSTTVEEAKVRGASSSSGALIRLAGGADLTLLTTGLAENTPAVLPTAPESVVVDLGRDILGEDAFSVPLTDHGPQPRKRYYFRTVRGALLAALLALVATSVISSFTDMWLMWIPFAALALFVLVGLPGAELRYRHLGHALTDHYLVARTGSYATVTTALQTDGVIGWRVKQGFFDRRVGLAQLTAMTAAGNEHVDIPDVPLGTAIAVAAAATPRTMAEFAS